MASPRGVEEEWERKEAMAAAMVDFLEGWVVRELYLRFRAINDAVYLGTFEHNLLKALVESEKPQSLQEIASKCGVSRALVLPERRLRRVIERMERSGMLSRSGPEDRPRYSLKRENLTWWMLEKSFKASSREGLIGVALHDSLSPQL